MENISKDNCTNTGEICGYLSGMADVCPRRNPSSLYPPKENDPLCSKDRDICDTVQNIIIDTC
tara:strand:- start:585 stop:773 length:189 start_codon:yes stop_codon:yes gene_type:complete